MGRMLSCGTRQRNSGFSLKTLLLLPLFFVTMDLPHGDAPRQRRAEQPYLSFQGAEVLGDRRVVPCRLGVATAEPAERLAEGDVDVERYGCAGRELSQPPAIGRLVGALVEVRRGRVARVAGRGRRILPDEICIHTATKAAND